MKKKDVLIGLFAILLSVGTFFAVSDHYFAARSRLFFSRSFENTAIAINYFLADDTMGELHSKIPPSLSNMWQCNFDFGQTWLTKQWLLGSKNWEVVSKTNFVFGRTYAAISGTNLRCINSKSSSPEEETLKFILNGDTLYRLNALPAGLIHLELLKGIVSIDTKEAASFLFQSEFGDLRFVIRGRVRLEKVGTSLQSQVMGNASTDRRALAYRFSVEKGYIAIVFLPKGAKLGKKRITDKELVMSILFAKDDAKGILQVDKKYDILPGTEMFINELGVVK